MCTISEYRKRLASNTTQYKKDRRNGRRGFNSDKYVYSCGAPFDPMTEYGNMADFAAAVAIGALPHKTAHGVDAIKLINGKLVHIELKMCTIDPSKVVIGPQGGLLLPGLTSDTNNKTALRSRMEGVYKIYTQACLRSKYIPTYLVARDSISGEIIDTYNITTSQIRQIFNTKRSLAKRITIKLSAFMRHGQQATTILPPITIEKFETILRECCTKRNSTSKPFDEKKYMRLVKSYLKSQIR